jgi:hypothetical protein
MNAPHVCQSANVGLPMGVKPFLFNFPIICYTIPMTRKAVQTVVLSSTADFFNGMSTAWAFASYDAIFRKAWIDC